MTSTAARCEIPDHCELIDKHDLAELRRKEMEWTRAKLDCQRGDLWFWQGDGSDYADSLSCHVVMSADNLRGLLVKAARGDRLDTLINSPEVDDFLEGVRREAPHQVERWVTEHDEGKTPADWFWLVGYLAGKALHAGITGDLEKAKHHTITAAGALANWHRHLVRGHSHMRPGIDGEAALGNAAHD